MNKSIAFTLALGLVTMAFNSCNKKENDENFNIFTVNQDIALGRQLVDYLESDSSGEIILEPSQYPEAYSHMERIRNKILNSGKVYYKDKFEWRVRIIHDDNTLNAFCAPGGYIYVYTGIIKYLDNEYELAGVLGHEIAHADKRHSTSQMTKQYGISILLAAVGGDQSVIGTLAANLVLLKYSRNDEAQSDQWSVEYLCPTTYKADGAAEFFRKIGSSPVPEFLSTHPDPKNRVEDITNYAAGKNCKGTETLGQYAAFKASLP